jgi:hypothetical protein
MRVALLVTALATLAACNTEKGQPGGQDSTPPDTAAPQDTAEVTLRPAPHVAIRAAIPPAKEPLAWADTTWLADTAVHYQWGRQVTTIVVDSERTIQLLLVRARPWGLFATWNGSKVQTYFAGNFTMAMQADVAASLPARIATATQGRFTYLLIPAGGARANYLTNGVFDMAKWKAKLQTFNTPTLKALVAKAVLQGVLIGSSNMDEPANTGGVGNEANSWGPAGTMNVARVDSMCGYARGVFHLEGQPDIPQGVFLDWGKLQSGGRGWQDQTFKVCDFATSQYGYRKGTLKDYLAGGLAMAAKHGMAASFAINTRDGGYQVKRLTGQKGWLTATWKPDAPGDCLSTSGGRGSYFPNCAMSPAQVKESGLYFIAASCLLTGFAYDPDQAADPRYQASFKAIADSAKRLPRKSCKRPAA